MLRGSLHTSATESALLLLFHVNAVCTCLVLQGTRCMYLLQERLLLYIPQLLHKHGPMRSLTLTLSRLDCSVQAQQMNLSERLQPLVAAPGTALPSELPTAVAAFGAHESDAADKKHVER